MRRPRSWWPRCGRVKVPTDPIPYDRFTTGYTYREISDMIWYSKQWHAAHHTRRRHAVLGKWREIKQEMYNQYLVAIEAGNEVPF